jgi:hypothetical protein
MDLEQLVQTLREGSLWVRRTLTCTDCDKDATWLAIRLSDRDLRVDWFCDDDADPEWTVADIQKLIDDPNLLLVIQPGAVATCTLRPRGPRGPRCGAPEEYLAIYPFDTPDGKIRVGPSCSACMNGHYAAHGEVLALPRELVLADLPD